MSTVARIALAGYLGISAVHLLFCLRGGERGRAVSKILLMPALLVYDLTVSWTVFDLTAAAILLGWGGDVLLLWPKRKLCFLGGLGSFLLGHVCYAAVMGLWIGNLSEILWPAVGSAVVLAGAGIAAYASLSSHVGEMRIPAIAYLAVILGMAWVAFLAMRTNPGFSGGCLFAGALCFLTSDYLLARELFVQKHSWGDFAVMLTYISAQLLLVTGLALP